MTDEINEGALDKRVWTTPHLSTLGNLADAEGGLKAPGDADAEASTHS